MVALTMKISPVIVPIAAKRLTVAARARGMRNRLVNRLVKGANSAVSNPAISTGMTTALIFTINHRAIAEATMMAMKRHAHPAAARTGAGIGPSFADGSLGVSVGSDFVSSSGSSGLTVC